MHHNNSIVVPRNLIIMNQQILLSFNNKNTFTFALLDIVKFNLTLTWTLSSQCNVSFDVMGYLVCNNIGWWAFNNQNALIVILLDYVGVRKRFNIYLKFVFV